MPTIRTVTVDREFGSGGNVIAEALAARLGWTLWDQLLTDEIARRLECDRQSVEECEERTDPAYYRLFRGFMRASFEGNVNTPRLRVIDTDRVRSVTQAIQIELADAGRCVIVGRGSSYYLGARRDAFHVFVYAPFANKVRRLMAQGKTEAAAEELAETVDRDRAAFIKRHFNVEWPAIHRFHLMVNSSIGDTVAVETILEAMARYGGTAK
jgi:cytidylate kinase-like protein